MKTTGLLQNRDLAEWLGRDPASLDTGTAEASRTSRGIRLSLIAPSARQPFDVIVTEMAGLTAARVTIHPGPIIGGAGYIIPTIGGQALTASPPPSFTSPKRFLAFKLTILPQVTTSTVAQTDLNTSPGNVLSPNTEIQRWISGATITAAAVVDANSLDDFPTYDAVGWTSVDGVKTGTYYVPFAQWNEDEKRYRRLIDDGPLVLNFQPLTDLQNLGQGPDNTTASFAL